MAYIIDGRAIALKIRKKIKEELDTLKKEVGITPGLAVILVGENPASLVYVKMKEKACKEIGIKSFIHRLPQVKSFKNPCYMKWYDSA